MNFHGKDIKIFAGNASGEIAAQMAHRLGLPLGSSEVTTFSDGEISVSIKESVRGSDVFVVQSTANPVNDSLMEMLIMCDAFKRASAACITAVIPYFGYARQDRKSKARDPITAKLVADLLVAAGADRVLTMDLHAPQIQGFFNIPVDNLLGVPILAPYFIEKFKNRTDQLTIVSPDLGSVTRARSFASKLDAPLAIVDKRRQRANISEVMNIIGDVQGKLVILVDDMIDTAGSLCNAAEAIIEKGGACEVYACATHGVFSGKAYERIEKSVLKEVVVLDTIRCRSEDERSSKIIRLPVGKVFADAIERIYQDLPVSPLYG